MNGHNSIEVVANVGSPSTKINGGQNGHAGVFGRHSVHGFNSDLKNVNGGGLIMDGSWELRVLVTDLQVERTLRVKSDLHIGGVMIKLVDELGKNNNNFSFACSSENFNFPPQ